MAKNSTQTAHATQELPPAMDYAEHERTYNGFIAVTKWSVFAGFVLLVFLYFAIRP